MPHSDRILLDMEPARARALFERVSAGGQLASKRLVPMPEDSQRRGTQGAAVYACAKGHAWLAFLVRRGDGFVPRDSGDLYCEDEPCVDYGTPLEEAQGLRISGVRFWTMR